MIVIALRVNESNSSDIVYEFEDVLETIGDTKIVYHVVTAKGQVTDSDVINGNKASLRSAHNDEA